MERWVAWLAAVVLVGAMVAPAVSDPPRDGFPLSTYPMFATHRGDRVVVVTAVGTDVTGEVHRLTPTLLAGANEPILAVRTATNLVGQGRAGAWCREVAQRVVGSANHGDIVAIEVRTETHDLMASVLDGADALLIEVAARCPVAAR